MAKTNYELTHPVISIRVSQQVYDELQNRRRNSQSYGDILRIGLDKQQAYDEPLMQRIEELEIESIKLEELIDRRTIGYPCYICDRPLTVESEQEKRVCIQALTGRFRHSTCK